MSVTVTVMATIISSIRGTLWCEELYGVETELLERRSPQPKKTKKGMKYSLSGRIVQLIFS
jgi:hypothetical protein